VTIVREAADDIRIMLFFKLLGIKKISHLVVTSKKLRNNFVGVVTNSFAPNVVRRLPV
jgi:hypothetical protein